MLTRSLVGRDTVGADTAPARWLQAQRHIRAHLADRRLSPTTIADALHISRSTLYTAQPDDSDGIAAEIRRQRLARAHTMLRDPTNSQSIAEIPPPSDSRTLLSSPAPSATATVSPPAISAGLVRATRPPEHEPTPANRRSESSILTRRHATGGAPIPR
jgi:AraC-like DNA-binding protein